MTTDVELSDQDRKFIEAANKLQAMGLFPSQLNFAKHTSYRVPYQQRIGEIRGRLVAMGALVITTEPSRNNRPLAAVKLSPSEQKLIVGLVNQSPKLTTQQIYRRFMKVTGRTSRFVEITTAINRVRDEAELGADVSDGEAWIAGRIQDENREIGQPAARRILAAELQRWQMANIERLTPAEASKVILEDWKQRFGRKKRSAARMTFSAKAYKTERKSVRAERERTVSYSRRGMPYAMEAMAR